MPAQLHAKAPDPSLLPSEPLQDVFNLQQLAEGLHHYWVIPVLGYGPGVNTHLAAAAA